MPVPFIEDEMTRAKRGITWIRLEEALHGTGCPVCTEIESTEKHYFEAMLYEYVLDAGVRRKLHRHHGFCTRHAKLALATELMLKSDGLHLATMFETVLEENVKLLQEQVKSIKESKKQATKRRRKGATTTKQADECFVCSFLEESENIALHDLLYFSNDDEFIEAYKKSKTTICFRHLQMVIMESTGPVWAERISSRVLEVTERKLNAIRRNLSNFIKKHDYQSEHDYTPEEINSYIDVVNFFSGRMRI